MKKYLRVGTCNFERNGNGDVGLRAQMHRRLSGEELDLLAMQEMFGFGVDGRESQAWNDSRTALGMHGELGPGKCPTALYWNPQLFTQRRNWADEVGDRWFMPPTALSLQLTGTAIPIVACSFHHVYDDPAGRESESNWLSRLGDKKLTLPDGRKVVLPAIVGGDPNSFVEAGVEGDVPLPRLDVPDDHPLAIRDEPHRNHRSRLITPGQPRVLDIWPDCNLRTAGMEDAARHLATVSGPEVDRARILAPTVEASPARGPAARIDRIYLSRSLLPAVVDLDVIDMSGLSDHHTVIVTLDHTTLVSLLTA